MTNIFTHLTNRLLAEVQRRRSIPTKLIQTIQNSQGEGMDTALIKKLFDLTFVRRLTTRIAAIGLWHIHVRYRKPKPSKEVMQA